MGATLTGIRTGLATRLATITGLRTHATLPDQVNPPCALVQPDGIDFDATMGRGLDKYRLTVRLLVARASERAAQGALDAYLAPTGAGSVKAAIEGDITLGGIVDATRVTRATGYGVYEVGGVPYLGCDFAIEVAGRP